MLLGAIACVAKQDAASDTSALDTSAVAVTPADTGSASTTSPAGPGGAPSPSPSTPAPSDSSPTSTAGWTMNAQGIGPVHAGMTVAQARAAGASGMSIPPGGSAGCTYATWLDAPRGVFVMLQDSRIARVDVRNGNVATAAGARIGDSEARIKSLYSGKIASTPHKYMTGGHYLTVTPGSGPYRIVFETDGRKVTTYRSGQTPAVELVESCG